MFYPSRRRSFRLQDRKTTFAFGKVVGRFPHNTIKFPSSNISLLDRVATARDAEFHFKKTPDSPKHFDEKSDSSDGINLKKKDSKQSLKKWMNGDSDSGESTSPHKKDKKHKKKKKKKGSGRKDRDKEKDKEKEKKDKIQRTKDRSTNESDNGKGVSWHSAKDVAVMAKPAIIKKSISGVPDIRYPFPSLFSSSFILFYLFTNSLKKAHQRYPLLLGRNQRVRLPIIIMWGRLERLP